MTGEGVQVHPIMRVSPGGALQTGIARERETSTDDAALCQLEFRTLACRVHDAIQIPILAGFFKPHRDRHSPA